MGWGANFDIDLSSLHVLEVHLSCLHQMRVDPLALRARPLLLIAATVRSSRSNAATMACRGHPCASSVTTVVTTVAGVRSPQNAVPVVGLKVPRHIVQR